MPADFQNGRLLRHTLATLAAIGLWFLLRRALPEAWHTPGSPPLYLAGVAGALLLLVPLVFATAKRAASANPRRWFNAHVHASLLGAFLIAIHSGGYLRRAPALLLLAIVALAALGIWARLRGARLMAATFASQAPGFRAPDDATRARLRSLIDAKRALLTQLDPGASEGTFSVTLHHLLRHPKCALAYLRLEQEETRLIGVRTRASLRQAWWRPLHIALAIVFVLGLLTHVITVTFFAGYVADGGPIGWWHLTAWGGGR